MKNKLYPTYELYLDEEDRFLLAAKKRSKNKTSNYIISQDAKSLGKDSASYLGKLRSNFVGTEFVVYDKVTRASE
jgi:tubby-related protein 1